MTRLNASLIQQLIRFSNHYPVAMMGLALVGVAAGQAAPVEASIERSIPSDGVVPQVSLQPVSTAGSISATAISSASSTAPQFSGSRESEVLLAQSIEAAADGTGSVVTQTGSTFDITGGTQTGANLFHSFEQLGLSAGEVANFLSNPAIQNILGRVVGGDASVINGLLQVTGGNANLFLMNPAGIIFGPNAQVIVPGAFTATTAEAVQLGDYWFNALGTNDYANLVGVPSGFAFTSSAPGALLNAGNLSGESVTLLGGFVVNTGTIEAPGGNITIAAVPGENLVRITQEGSLLSLDLPTEARNGLNSVGQTLTTLEIPDLLGGGSAPQGLGLVVQNGVVKLASTNTTLPTEAGTAIASGLLDASDTAPSSTGGTIDVLGNRVALLDATLQASGSAGGGTVRVGGDYRGQGTVPNAEQTYVGAGSTIAADALAEGDGGRVIVWADDSTRFYGAISARGGAVSGDGGFAEVSGRETLVFDGNADVGAANGVTGTLLLDPRNIRISNEPSTNGVDSELPDIFANNFLGSDITINATALTDQKGNVRLEATDDIMIEDGLSLTFAPCSSFPCFIEFRADADGDGLGSFLMDRTQSIETAGRSISIIGSNIQAGEIDIENNSRNLDVRVNLRANSGSILAGDIRGGGTVRLYADRNITTGLVINNYVKPGDLETDRPIIDLNNPYGGVFLTTRTGNIRISGIDTLPGFLEVNSGGLFQAIGSLRAFPQTLGERFPSDRLPRVDINLPTSQAIRNFLLDNGYITNANVVNTTAVRNFLIADGQLDANAMTEGELASALLIRSGNRDLIRSNNQQTPITILLRGTDDETFGQITTSQERALSVEGGSIQTLSPRFVVGPQVRILPEQRFNLTSISFADASLNSSNDIAITYQDYSSLLPFDSASFPSTVSGIAGTFVAGFLEDNVFIGSSLSPVEYVPPPPVPPVTGRGEAGGTEGGGTGSTTNFEIPRTSERALLASVDNSGNTSEQMSQEAFENDDCEMFSSSEFLSVEEVTPEECQASTTPETPLVRASYGEAPSMALPPVAGGSGGTGDTANPDIATTNEQVFPASVGNFDITGEQASQEAPKKDVCEIIVDSSEVLSLEEVASEECRAATAPETLLVETQNEEAP